MVAARLHTLSHYAGVGALTVIEPIRSRYSCDSESLAVFYSLLVGGPISGRN